MPRDSSTTPQKIQKELEEGAVRPFYYLYGEEKLGIDLTLESVRRVLFGHPPSRSRSEIAFYGNEVHAKELLEAALTLPMLARRQMITVKGAHEMPQRETERLVPYLDAPADFTCLVFTADTIERKGKFFQALQRHGALVEFRPLAEKELPRWVQEQARQAGVELSRQAAAALVELVGGQMDLLKGELDKLLLYAEGQKIDVRDIQRVAIDSHSFSIFELVDAVGNRNAEISLRILGKMLDAGEEPLMILGMICRQIRHIWQVKQLRVQSKSTASIQRETGLSPWVVEKLHRNGQRFSEKDLLAAILLLAQTDLALKSSRLDSRLIMEGLIMSLCRKGG
jgi:DNA polymerase-3 subunit delta